MSVVQNLAALSALLQQTINATRTCRVQSTHSQIFLPFLSCIRSPRSIAEDVGLQCDMASTIPVAVLTRPVAVLLILAG